MNYPTEAALRDHLAQAARDHGWTARTEWRLAPMRDQWGIVDLLLTKDGEAPAVVEVKHRIANGSGVRAAAAQAHSYRTIADVYLGEPCAAYVVAERITARDEPRWVALGYLDVHVHTAAEFIGMLNHGGDYLAFSRDLRAHIYGSTVRGEPFDEMSAALQGHTPETLADLRELREAAPGSLMPTSALYGPPSW